ncbi:hypothetical protein AJ79_08411 [Helicocarpus griseus UAMH5409]|uniref:Zn(2)-C6 fungal-type domain-containing protein n=1 Tax=Helicocarpus griseus UAMH5409 TaxID=1447875 RepID=A0A2B7WT63_9EURO|nr:hypothetical protein AJ79_08411 [Helicocarpus griseus UAMH5409]
MTYPSRGCLTCKKRRVKCDESRPICDRCQKAKLTCDNVGDGRFIFLNENEFVVGRRKRPRGPNVNARLTSQAGDNQGGSTSISQAQRQFRSSGNAGLGVENRPSGAQSLIAPSLKIPLGEQALNYYYRNYLEMEHSLPDIAHSHLKYVVASPCFAQPQSILGLAVSAVSHATFGRAWKSHTSSTAGAAHYSKALFKTKLALQNFNDAVDDGTLLAIMILGFYENSVTDKSTQASNHILPMWASRTFAHHDGALAVLKLRRQLSPGTTCGKNLDKLVRRQLMRSLLLRNMCPPPWLEDGAEYGEHDFILELDRSMVEVSKIRYRASALFADHPFISPSDESKMTSFRLLLTEAQLLENDLAAWANCLPMGSWYTTHIVKNKGFENTRNSVFNSTVHIYSSVGYSGVWNRYRALRLAVNDIILKVLSAFNGLPDFDSPINGPLSENAKLTIQHLADDLCASVPYMLGLVELNGSVDHDDAIEIKAPASLKTAVKATTATLLCWPLAMAAMVIGIPESHRKYIKDCLLVVSELVDDGVLERIAASDTPVNTL